MPIGYRPHPDVGFPPKSPEDKREEYMEQIVEHPFIAGAPDDKSRWEAARVLVMMELRDNKE